MISRLRGVIWEKQAPLLVLDVSGVGYELHCPMTTFYRLPAPGQEASLYVQMIVREDAQLLYGFFDSAERTLFRSLIKVNGVGPKLALAILSGMEPDAFVQCVMHDDVATLVKLPGVGKKTAERLIVEMRDRLKELGDVDAMAVNAGQVIRFKQEHSPVADAISALQSLGYKPADAQKVVSKLDTEGLASEEIIKQALRSLAS